MSIPGFPLHAQNISASDVATFSDSAIYVGTGGNVVVRDLEDGTLSFFANVPSGSVLPVQVRAVMVGGTVNGVARTTTAGDFVRLF